VHPQSATVAAAATRLRPHDLQCCGSHAIHRQLSCPPVQSRPGHRQFPNPGEIAPPGWATVISGPNSKMWWSKRHISRGRSLRPVQPILEANVGCENMHRTPGCAALHHADGCPTRQQCVHGCVRSPIGCVPWIPARGTFQSRGPNPRGPDRRWLLVSARRIDGDPGRALAGTRACSQLNQSERGWRPPRSQRCIRVARWLGGVLCVRHAVAGYPDTLNVLLPHRRQRFNDRRMSCIEGFGQSQTSMASPFHVVSSALNTLQAALPQTQSCFRV